MHPYKVSIDSVVESSRILPPPRLPRLRCPASDFVRQHTSNVLIAITHKCFVDNVLHIIYFDVTSINILFVWGADLMEVSPTDFGVFVFD